MEEGADLFFDESLLVAGRRVGAAANSTSSNALLGLSNDPKPLLILADGKGAIWAFGERTAGAGLESHEYRRPEG